jgi:hypothetical protein
MVLYLHAGAVLGTGRPIRVAVILTQVRMCLLCGRYTHNFSPQTAPMPPWKEWVENLGRFTGIPDSQLDEVREAYRVWKDAYDQVKMARRSASSV